MLSAEYLRYHIDALLGLSRGTKDPAASAKLQEMADELRIIVSVTEIAGCAGGAGNRDKFGDVGSVALPKQAESDDYGRRSAH